MFINLLLFSNGGIIPPFAQSLHRQHIEEIVNKALKNANVSINDLDAIATTTKPGTSHLTI